MREGPRRVARDTGNPISREVQRQATLGHDSIPTERQESGSLHRYSMNREIVTVVFDVDDNDANYVANETKTISGLKLTQKPTGFHYHVVSAGDLDVTPNTSILVLPVNRESWTSDSIQVRCNQSRPMDDETPLAPVEVELWIH